MALEADGERTYQHASAYTAARRAPARRQAAVEFCTLDPGWVPKPR
jgi:hypothetical protein